MPVTVSLGTGLPPRLRHQADGQIGAGPSEANRVEAALVEKDDPLLQSCQMRSPGRDGVVLVQPGRDHDGVPEALDVRLAEHDLRPTRVRIPDDGPRDPPVARRP